MLAALLKLDIVFFKWMCRVGAVGYVAATVDRCSRFGALQIFDQRMQVMRELKALAAPSQPQLRTDLVRRIDDQPLMYKGYRVI